MSTAVATADEKKIVYMPLGETTEVRLTIPMVRQYLCKPTAKGEMPTDEQVTKFMMLCRAQSLNPWVDDCYLVGYDGNNGPEFSLITAHKALLKRAEASPQYDGMEGGVVACRKAADGSETIAFREGDLLLNGETLVGGWARVYRKDRSHPSYDAVNFATFDTGKSRWKKDPGGMIVKCAEASALRMAFPSTLAAMYCREEMEHLREGRGSISPTVAVEAKRTSPLQIKLDAIPAKQINPPAPETEVVTEAGEIVDGSFEVVDLMPQLEEELNAASIEGMDDILESYCGGPEPKLNPTEIKQAYALAADIAKRRQTLAEQPSSKKEKAKQKLMGNTNDGVGQ